MADNNTTDPVPAWQQCHACGGAFTAGAAAPCRACGGSGWVPVPDPGPVLVLVQITRPPTGPLAWHTDPTARSPYLCALVYVPTGGQGGWWDPEEDTEDACPLVCPCGCNP